jgi:hypothetical protein
MIFSEKPVPTFPDHALNAPVTNFNPVAGTIIGMARGRGKPENGPVDGFSGKALHANRRQITALWKDNRTAPNSDS